MSYLKIFEIKKSNLKKERRPNSTKERTVSSDRRRCSISISLRDHSSRDRLCADHYVLTDTDEDATRRESERNYFAGTDIERITLVQTSSGLRCAAFAGTDIHDSARLCTTRLTLNRGCALRTALLHRSEAGFLCASARRY